MVLQKLVVRPRWPEEQERARTLLEQEHYLDAAAPVGRTLAQVVHHHGRWVALLVWGPAALKLTDRDQWIGWSPTQRTSGPAVEPPRRG